MILYFFIDMKEKIKNFLQGVYTQLVKANDTPQRTALGFGVGVFLGILPGTGPLAALALAWIFRLNKAATLLGGILTNTWLTVITFVLAIKAGCAVLGVHWQTVDQQAHDLMSHFSWKVLFDVSLMNILKPLLVGYLVLGFLCGLASYALALIILVKRPRTTS